MRKKIVIAGGSGFLGTRLTEELVHTCDVVILTRHPARNKIGAREIYWDGQNVGPWKTELEGAHALINLTGKNVNCRFTARNRAEIMNSRVNSVEALGRACQELEQPPRCWIQASSLAIYGDTGDSLCTEGTPHTDGFPPVVCTEWEKALARWAPPGMRTVILRIGFVLDRGRGALGTLEKLTKAFLGGPVGSGQQYVSWIHWLDMNAMFLKAIESESTSGIYNATSPNPVTNAELMRELRRVLGRPWSTPVPAWLAHVGAFFVRTEAMLALTGRRCIPKRFLAEGFRFKFSNLKEALEEVEMKGTRKE